MTSTYTIIARNPEAIEVIERETDLDAIRAVYDTLYSWSDDDRRKADLDKAVAEGLLWTEQNMERIWLAEEPRAFWLRAAALLTSDEIDFFPGLEQEGEY